MRCAEASVEFLLHSGILFDVDVCIAPLFHRGGEPSLLVPISPAAEEVIDAPAVYDTFQMPLSSSEALSPGRRLLRLAECADSWSHSYCADLSRSVFYGALDASAVCEAVVEELIRQSQFAAYLGCCAVLIPNPASICRYANTLLTAEVTTRVAVWIRQFVAASPRTRIWVMYAPTTDDWGSWNRLREAIGLNNGPFCKTLDVIPPHSVQPFLALDSMQAAPESVWLGEDVAAVTLSANWLHGISYADVEASRRMVDGEIWGHCSRVLAAPAEGNSTILPWYEWTRRMVCTRRVLPTVTMGGESEVAPSVDSTFSSVEAQLRTFDVHFCTPSDATNQFAGGEGLSSLRDLFAASEDVLQVPLEPLAHHMENAVYHTFERDRPKYNTYRVAVEAFLRDYSSNASSCGGDVVVMVLGGGRGPLATEVLAAATNTNSMVHVVIVEKNPSAVAHMLLKLQYDAMWRTMVETVGHSITVLEGDGRDVTSLTLRNALRPANAPAFGANDVPRLCASVVLVVSELLGSAADNELSPECIDGTLKSLLEARHSVHAESGQLPSHGSIVSIPMSYDLLVAPLMSSALCDRLRDVARRGIPCSAQCASVSSGHASPQEAVYRTPMVCHLTRGLLLAPPQVVWSFSHTARDVVEDTPHKHDRAAIAEFRLPCAGRADALMGMMDVVLYRSEAAGDGGAVRMSTVPSRWTQGMYSWFPMVYALPSPRAVSDTLRVRMTRSVQGSICFTTVERLV